MFNIGDIVVKKDQTDLFVVISVEDSLYLLRGYNIRIKMKAKEEELKLAPKAKIESEILELEKIKKRLLKNTQTRTRKVLSGRILHIDGDPSYLKSCTDLYHDLGLYSYGVFLDEKHASEVIENIMRQVTPNIVVITGHDAFHGEDIKELNNYENSPYFVKTIRKIRELYGEDEVIIIAGACTSCFEALIASGANFASSPGRINIHTYDPAVVAIKCATTSSNQTINFEAALKYIENGSKAFNGIETKGKMKLLYK